MPGRSSSDESKFDKEQLANQHCILQEPPKHVQTHAKTNSVEIDLYGDDESMVLLIADDVIVFEMADSPQGIGLANMQRRSEVFGRSHTIKTSPGKDCAVVATMQQKPRENVE